VRVASPGWPGHATRGRSFSNASHLNQSSPHQPHRWITLYNTTRVVPGWKSRCRRDPLLSHFSTQETEARERRAPRDVISFVKAWRRNTSYLTSLPGIIETSLHARIPPRYSLALTAGKSHVIMLRSTTLDQIASAGINKSPVVRTAPTAFSVSGMS
jgi:hypothetical protein